ncbi:MAG: type II toxin-antitoxin system Phd/YefM family antitoxin [Candidatus Levybacteria bacterium]|nr:type II toxin-antitoxin system Phd/YefM family antitoxin [Candidatus Levybacteria bacterium]
MPKTVSSSDIQKKYREIFDEVKKTKEPVIVLHGNKPDVAIVDFNYLEKLEQASYELELKDALEAIREGDKELKAKKIKAFPFLAKLLDENK